MSLPGIRPALLERGGDGRAWGGGSHFSGDASKSQQTHSFWSNKAGVEATHAQGSSGLESQDSTDEHEGGDAVAAEAGIASSIRMKRSKPVKWSIEEDRRLRDAVSKFDEARWKDIANLVETRNHVQCLQRWKKVLKPGLVKGQWSQEEDNRLVGVVERGFRNWGQVASFMEGRTSKQCRERWCHHLDPAVRKGGYTTEEDDLIIILQGEVGNRWADIAKRLTGRTENAVKIRWKALNRRQRDARNKAAAAAAMGSVGEADSANDVSPNSTTNPPRTGPREATRTTARAASRVTAVSAASRRTTKKGKRGCKNSGGGSTGGESSRGSDSDSSPLSAGCRSPSSASRDSAAARSQRPSVPVPAAIRAAAIHAAAMATAAANAATDEQTAFCWLDGDDQQPVSFQQSREDGTGLSLTATDNAKQTPRPPALSAPQHSAFGGGGDDAHEPGESAEEGKDGGLHRLCAALRNVEAMDNLQETEDVVDAHAAATAAPAERLKRKSASAESQPHGRNSPVHSASSAPRSDDSADGSGTLDKQEDASRPTKRLKAGKVDNGGTRPSPSTSCLQLGSALSLSMVSSKPDCRLSPSSSASLRGAPSSTTAAASGAAVFGKKARLLQSLSRAKIPCVKSSMPPEEHVVDSPVHPSASNQSLEQMHGQPATPVASEVAGNPWGVQVRPMSGSDPVVLATAASVTVCAVAAAVAAARPSAGRKVIPTPLPALISQTEKVDRPAVVVAQKVDEQQAAQDRETAAAAVASLFSFQSQMQPPDLLALQGNSGASTAISANAPVGAKRARDRGADIAAVAAEISRTLGSTSPTKQGRRSPSHSSSSLPAAVTISKSSGAVNYRVDGLTCPQLPSNSYHHASKVATHESTCPPRCKRQH